MNYYSLFSRSLIALLFVVAGTQKAMHFQETVGAIGLLVPASVAAIVTIVVIIIEVPVALAFAWGYRTCIMGWLLVGFTALTIVFIHRDFSVADNMVMALKNLAIIGGIMLGINTCTCGRCPAGKDCTCGVCEDCKKKADHHGHNH